MLGNLRDEEGKQRAQVSSPLAGSEEFAPVQGRVASQKETEQTVLLEDDSEALRGMGWGREIRSKAVS